MIFLAFFEFNCSSFIINFIAVKIKGERIIPTIPNKLLNNNNQNNPSNGCNKIVFFKIVG